LEKRLWKKFQLKITDLPNWNELRAGLLLLTEAGHRSDGFPFSGSNKDIFKDLIKAAYALE